MCMDQKALHGEDIISPQIKIQVYTILIKITTRTFVYVDKIILKVIQKGKGSRITETILKKQGEFSLPDFKS